MSTDNNYMHSQWASRLVFITAVIGSAVGLGNIWKFPYMAGEQGGAPFILIYLVFVFLMGLPVMASEIMLGRHGKRSTVGTFVRFGREYGTHPGWKIIGVMGIITGILILSFYSVIAGWLIFYIFNSASSAFDNLTAQAVSNIFDDFIKDPESLILWHTVFMLVTAVVFVRDINAGIGKVVSYCMPLLFFLMIAIVIYNIYYFEMAKALNFMFAFDWDKVKSDTVLVALSHAFFSLSIGMGAVMIYGSYLSDRVSLLGTTSIIVISDTLVAIVAGLMIFPILFSFGFEPSQGVGLIFKTLPIAFSQMPGGVVIASLFFFLLFIAAWTSALSLVEPALAWLIERTGWTRAKGVVFVAGCAWLLGLATVFSFNIWEEVKLMGKTPFDWIESLTADIMLPLGGLLIIVFAGWVLPNAVNAAELRIKKDFAYRVWRASTRYFCPVVLFIILLVGLKEFFVS